MSDNSVRDALHELIGGAPPSADEALRLLVNLTGGFYRLSAEEARGALRGLVMSVPVPDDVVLLCPECGAPLTGFRCLQCRRPTMKAKDAAAAVARGGALGFLYLLGAIFRPVGSVVNKDLQREEDLRRSVLADEIALARRYQSSAATYDQAAFCYLSWLKRMGEFECPEGLIEFLGNYRLATEVNTRLRRSLFDVAFVKTFGQMREGRILDAVFDNSKAQVAAAKVMTAFFRQTDHPAHLEGWITDFVRMGIVEYPPKYGDTALAWASRAGYDDVVARLLASGAKVDEFGKEGPYRATPLWWACKKRFLRTVELLLAASANPNVATPAGGWGVKSGETPLMVASQQGDVDVVERLLAAGADVEIVIPPKSRVELSWEGSTALMQASILGHADVVRQLLAAGARVEATNKSGQTALMLATRKKHVAVVQLLSAAGNDKRL